MSDIRHDRRRRPLLLAGLVLACAGLMGMALDGRREVTLLPVIAGAAGSR